jgi:hypothetical protein
MNVQRAADSRALTGMIYFSAASDALRSAIKYGVLLRRLRRRSSTQTSEDLYLPASTY